jgi:hypothetical protein
LNKEGSDKMSPNKDTAMLIDVQYVKANKKNNTPDYLYIIWKDLETGEKYLQAVPEPKMDIYFEKPELRNHSYNKNYEKIENLNKVSVKAKDVIFEIANDAGESGKRFIQNAFETKNYSALNQLYLYPYVYGADYDVASWYRIQWKMHLDNDTPKKLKKGFIDIEVDGLEVPGMPSPQDCPINAITLIDDSANKVYTFLLVDRPIIMKELSFMTQQDVYDELHRKSMYDNMHKAQHQMMKHPEEIDQKLHEMFDESYGKMDYNIYFYSDERKMLVHFWQLVNLLKLDIIGIWNISFDIPYFIERMEVLGLDPKEVMSHPDFPVKQCYFKADKVNHDIKNKSDSFFLTSYTVFVDQMELYAATRKGASELRSYKLNFIANHELRDSKLNYEEEGDIKTLPYRNFLWFVIYNIKDVLLQMGIERRVSDFDSLYVSSYQNATSFDKVFKKTVTLRNVEYLSFLEQGLIPGENINIYNQEEEKSKKYYDDEDEEDDDDDFEGALVADPLYNGYVGVELYGKKTNNIFANGIDFDMSAFYPNSIYCMNIDPSTLIFKVIMPIKQFNIFGGKLKFRGITGKYFEKEDDGAKECFDNFQTGNYMTTSTKWLNMPDLKQIHDRLKKKLK